MHTYIVISSSPDNPTRLFFFSSYPQASYQCLQLEVRESVRMFHITNTGEVTEVNYKTNKTMPIRMCKEITLPF